MLCVITVGTVYMIIPRVLISVSVRMISRIMMLSALRITQKDVVVLRITQRNKSGRINILENWERFYTIKED